MIRSIVIHGSKAIQEYESSGIVPSEEWLEQNDCSVCEKEFASMAEYKAYTDALEENDGYDDWRMLTPTIDNKQEDSAENMPITSHRNLYAQLQDLHRKFIDELRSLPLRPNDWLPHTVYVEEEGDNPVYTRYRLEDIKEDGSCVLLNPETNERFTERHLYEINIDWLDTVLRWYKECCVEEDIWKTHAQIILKRTFNEDDVVIKEFVDSLWQKCWSDEENISLFNEWRYPHKPTFKKNDFVKLTDDAISIFRECFGNDAAEYRKNMNLKVIVNKQNECGIWITEVRDIDEDDTQEFRSSMLRPMTVNELRRYVIQVLDKH